jgi:hypothetical protein
MTLRRQVSLVLLLFPSDFIIAQKKSNFKPIFIQFEFSNLALIRAARLILLVRKNFTNGETGGITGGQNTTNGR